MQNDPPKLGSIAALLLVLTVTTGLIDGVSVLGLGRVFTANMTGNIVFLGFALAGVPGFSLSRSVTALAAFLVGAVVGGRLASRLDPSRHRWLLVVALVEASLLFVAALVARGYDSESLVPITRLYTLIALTALAMGVRNATVRRLAVPDLTTTVLTLTLAGLGADSVLAGGTNPLAASSRVRCRHAGRRRRRWVAGATRGSRVVARHGRGDDAGGDDLLRGLSSSRLALPAVLHRATTCTCHKAPRYACAPTGLFRRQ
jgi:uncharacterized membrane protein YoaK (UPF0700 family)